MSQIHLTPENLEKAAGMMKAIAHPVRIGIIEKLEERGRLSVTEIQKQLGIEQATASHHLGIMKDKGVLTARREGKNIYYSLKHDTLSALLDCVRNCCRI